MVTPRGWECPKCGSIWAPFVDQCSKCNLTIAEQIPLTQNMCTCPRQMVTHPRTAECLKPYGGSNG